MKELRAQGGLRLASLVLALASLLLLGWAAWQLGRAAYIGATWSWHTGIVDAVDPEGPAAGHLQPGDRIRTIDELPVWAARQAILKQAGESLKFVVDGAGLSHSAAVRLAGQPPGVLLRTIEPLLIALAFWVLSVVVLVFAPPGTQKWPAWLFGQAMSATLAAGAMSWQGPWWTTRLFGVLLWWFGPVAILFHLHFPAHASRRPVRRIVLGLIGVALLGSLPEIVGDPVALRLQAPALFTARLLWLAGCLLGVVLVLVQTYRHTPSPATRRRVGLVVIGGAGAFLPFLTLSLLPDALLGRPLLPYAASFLFLLLLPLSYGYAIFRYHLMPVDRYISRAAAGMLVIASLGGGYLAAYAVSLRVLPAPIRQHPIMILLFALLIGMTAGAAHRRLQIVVNRLLYGGWHDYHSAVQYLSQTLEPETDDLEFGQNLCEGVQAAMELTWACLLLADEAGTLHRAGLVGEVNPQYRGVPVRLGAESPIAGYFRHEQRPIDGAVLRERLDDAALSPPERYLLECEHGRLWMPLSAGEGLLGLLILGPKCGSDRLDPTDRDILQVVARQASIALQNIQMSAELRQRAADSVRLHRQLLRVREAERARVARELHDEVIQELVRLKHQLEEVRTSADGDEDDRPAQLEDRVQQIVSDVRQLCSDLRPPTLDTLGLVGAVRSHLRMVKQTAAFQVRLVVEGDEAQALPGDVALCLFRVVQEALHNIQKHAAAGRVEVRLGLEPQEVRLMVADDGRGFEVPRRLQRLLDHQHFGLAGLHERLESVHGTLAITSEPGEGTRVQAWVPLVPPIEASHAKEGRHGDSTITG